jgi:hypothetical protein
MGGQDGQHWEGVLTPRSVAICEAYERDCPKSMEIKRLYDFGPDRQQVRELSVNHWKQGISVELARAAAWDRPAYEAAAKVIHAWLDMEGHAWWLVEQCVGGAHSGVHAWSELQALRAAKRVGDPALAARLQNQVDRLWAVAAAVTTPSGVWACIGERGGSVESQMSALWRVANGMPHRGALGDNPGQLTTDSFWLASRVATGMRAKGDLAKPATGAPLPAMRRGLQVHRWNGGHLTIMAELGRTDSPQQWLQCDWRLLDASERHPAPAFQTGIGMAPIAKIPSGARVMRSAA